MPSRQRWAGSESQVLPSPDVSEKEQGTRWEMYLGKRYTGTKFGQKCGESGIKMTNLLEYKGHLATFGVKSGKMTGHVSATFRRFSCRLRQLLYLITGSTYEFAQRKCLPKNHLVDRRAGLNKVCFVSVASKCRSSKQNIELCIIIMKYNLSNLMITYQPEVRVR